MKGLQYIDFGTSVYLFTENSVYRDSVHCYNPVSEKFITVSWPNPYKKSPEVPMEYLLELPTLTFGLQHWRTNRLISDFKEITEALILFDKIFDGDRI